MTVATIAIRWRAIRAAALSLLLMANSLVGTPLAAPPPARQFVDKRSSSSSSSGGRTTVGDLMRANPLLASLAMFRGEDGGQLLLQEPVDITSNSLAETVAAASLKEMPSLASSRSRIGRRKGSGGGHPHSLLLSGKPSSMAAAAAAALLLNTTTRHGQMDNFEPLYQIFNATLFDMAIPLEAEERGGSGRKRADGGEKGGGKGRRAEKGAAAEPAWKLALPWGMPMERGGGQSSVGRGEGGGRKNDDDDGGEGREPAKQLGKDEENNASNGTMRRGKIGGGGGVDVTEGTATALEATTTSSRPWREGRLVEKEEQEEAAAPVEGNLLERDETAAGNSGLSTATADEPPFEVTDSLRLALSTAPPKAAEDPVTLVMAQEEFPMGELEEAAGKAWKYPWERQRGEQQQKEQQHQPTTPLSSSSSSSSSPSSPSSLPSATTTTQNPPHLLSPFPPVMPGASFYVDQHVSHGPFGREPDTAPELVYDPNVLQRYGYTGMLPQTDGQLVRFDGGGRARNVPAHFGVAQQQRLSPVQSPITPPQSSISLVPAAAVFFIPAPPRLSMARAIASPSLPPFAPTSPHGGRLHGQLTATNRDDGPSPAGHKKLGFWPTPAKWAVEEEEELERLSTPGTITSATPSSGAMTPMDGNHLRWVPLEKVGQLAKLAGHSGSSREFETFEEFGEATKFPCIADPPEFVLTDAPTELGPALASCFRRVRQCVLHMARPMERRVGLPLGECVQLCVGQKQCQSVVFAHPKSICDIFSVRNGTIGTSGRLLYHRDFDYLEPRKMAQMNLSECWEAMDGPSGRAGSGGNGRLADSGGSENSSNGTSNSTEGSPPPPSSSMEMPRDICAAERDIVVFKSQGYRLADRSRKQRAVGEPPPAEVVVAENGAATTSKVLGQQSTETECIFSCLVNLARGKTPFECLAATFDQVQSSCLLYGPGSAADGSVHLVPDASFAHYEKGCIHEQLVELCQGLPIARYPQKTLLGFALGSRRAGSLVECLELCWTHNTAASSVNGTTTTTVDEAAIMTGGAQKCRSVVFFYEESGGHNCMLNSESRDTAPAFFVDENEALVDYASFDGCFRAGENEEEAERDLEEALAGRGEERAVLSPKKKKEPKLLRLRPLPERRRKPDKRRIYYTKNAGQTAGMERRLARLVDSEKREQPNSSRGNGTMAKGQMVGRGDGGRLMNSRRHGGQTGGIVRGGRRGGGGVGIVTEKGRRSSR